MDKTLPDFIINADKLLSRQQSLQALPVQPQSENAPVAEPPKQINQRDIEFLYEIGTMRFIQRTWRQFLNPDFQNVAEHTLRVTWIALVLAKYEQVANTEKIIKMAIVHDISESRTGDRNYLQRQYTEHKEHEAIHDMLKDTALEAEFLAIWKEYEERTSIEAKIVKDADNLDVDFELAEGVARGYKIYDEQKNPIRRHVKEAKLYTESAKRFWEAMQGANPHDWHLNSNNRYNAGDWQPEEGAGS